MGVPPNQKPIERSIFNFKIFMASIIRKVTIFSNKIFAIWGRKESIQTRKACVIYNYQIEESAMLSN